MQSISLETAQSGDWDILIIGTGMGGGFLGRQLAEAGLSVLFLEKGPIAHPAEQVKDFKGVDPQSRQMRGYWPKPAEFRKGGKEGTRFFGPYGSGVGGSSVFYAGALERPERHDIDDDPTIPHPTGGWPVSFDTYQPYFEAARRLLKIGGELDPLASDPDPGLLPPLPVPSGDQAIIAEMKARGLNPYRLHLAFSKPDCRQCIGRKCPWGCKMDSRSAGVIPALATGRAALLADCDVREILDDGGSVTGVRASCEGQDVVLTARQYALSGGSFGSAKLLLASTGTNPKGCANSSDWVGRGLMFHLDEYFVLWPRMKKGETPVFGKSISSRDLYRDGDQRYGLVQSVGIDASYGNMVMYLNQLFDQSLFRHFGRLRALLRFPALVLSRLFGNATVMTAMMEDFPYPENRILLSDEHPDILTFQYSYKPELLARRKKFRKLMRRKFKGHRRFMVSLQPVLNFGHPLGTVRFGSDPKTSVLRPDCRTHDLDNLYVVDGSFMPSAMGVNPSLMIAANALRVADIIAARQKEDHKDAALQHV